MIWLKRFLYLIALLLSMGLIAFNVMFWDSSSRSVVFTISLMWLIHICGLLFILNDFGRGDETDILVQIPRDGWAISLMLLVTLVVVDVIVMGPMILMLTSSG